MIWIVGNKGMLGTELTQYLQEQGLSVLGTDRDVNFLKPDDLSAFARDKPITWIINCAAYTAVDNLSFREGKKVVSTYIGSAGNPKVVEISQQIRSRRVTRG